MSAPVRAADVMSGRVSLSRLAEQRGGWLGQQRRDPAEDDPSYGRETGPTLCPDCGTCEGEVREFGCQQRPCGMRGVR